MAGAVGADEVGVVFLEDVARALLGGEGGCKEETGKGKRERTMRRQSIHWRNSRSRRLSSLRDMPPTRA